MEYEHRILELYSGIGGMHCAWIESGLSGYILAAVDINNIANDVYQHNFAETKMLNRNIQSIKVEEINKLNVNTILMSPPCQPFTRNGKYLDQNDARTCSFIYLINIIEYLHNIEYILMENVKGFECSTVRDLFIEKLNKCNFKYQEFLVCPTMVGVPNSRLRYYCIARRSEKPWQFKERATIMQYLPVAYTKPYPLSQIIDTDIGDEFLLSDKILKKGNILDIRHKESDRSCCFTKAYSHYLEGTGSVFTNADPKTVEECFKCANKFYVGSDEFVEAIKPLKLRFFSPKEILSLMSFPKTYEFPPKITRKQCYRLLGNSINVKLTSELLKIMVSYKSILFWHFFP